MNLMRSGGGNGTHAFHLGVKRCSELNPLALLASHGMLLTLGFDTPVIRLGPWVSVQAAVNHYTPGRAVSARAAFAGATRGGWWAGGAPDGKIGTLVPHKPVSYAVWDVWAIEIGAPRDAVQCWSTDRCSRVPVYRGWARPTPYRIAAKPCPGVL
ncbi:amidohydrolase family protein [Mycobacterium lepromatosis]|uniref:amidohydrolase family protein n=1 Tax=Mycobacterium lepromatosis TaxID=480418 RepID=UPI000A93F9F4|nr:amidohydrolase family protein [Mycobacterium lepromatosis]